MRRNELMNKIKSVDTNRRVNTNKLAEMMTTRDKGSKEIVVEIGLAVIAIALLLVFKQSVNTIITDLMADASSAISAMFTS